MKFFVGHVWMSRDSEQLAAMVEVELHHRTIEALIMTVATKLEMKTAITVNTHLVPGDDLTMVTGGRFSYPVRDFFAAFPHLKNAAGAMVLWRRAVKNAPIVLIPNIHGDDEPELIAHWRYRYVRDAGDEKLGLYIEPV